MYHYNDTRSRDLVSRVCTVAQYAVSEANAKSMGEAHFHTLTPPKPLNPRRHIKYITTVSYTHLTLPTILRV